MHGGRAPQVAAAREARVIAGEAALRAAGTTAPRDPGEALLAAAQDADAILQRIKVGVADGSLSPALLTACGDWLDRVSRLSKVVLDARIDERKVRVDQARVQLQAQAVEDGLAAAGVTGEQRATVIRVMIGRLREATAIEGPGS